MQVCRRRHKHTMRLIESGVCCCLQTSTICCCSLSSSFPSIHLHQNSIKTEINRMQGAPCRNKEPKERDTISDQEKKREPVKTTVEKNIDWFFSSDPFPCRVFFRILCSFSQVLTGRHAWPIAQSIKLFTRFFPSANNIEAAEKRLCGNGLHSSFATQ